MTEQEIFDTVLAHLREQGEASTNRSGECRYRGEGGTSCAVGCLIPDELYDPMIEGLVLEQIVADCVPDCYRSRAHELLPIMDRIRERLGAEHLQLLEELQGAHDRELFIHGQPAWENEMRHIARRFGLAYTPA